MFLDKSWIKPPNYWTLCGMILARVFTKLWVSVDKLQINKNTHILWLKWVLVFVDCNLRIANWYKNALKGKIVSSLVSWQLLKLWKLLKRKSILHPFIHLTLHIGPQRRYLRTNNQSWWTNLDQQTRFQTFIQSVANSQRWSVKMRCLINQHPYEILIEADFKGSPRSYQT